MNEKLKKNFKEIHQAEQVNNDIRNNIDLNPDLNEEEKVHDSNLHLNEHPLKNQISVLSKYNEKIENKQHKEEIQTINTILSKEIKNLAQHIKQK